MKKYMYMYVHICIQKYLLKIYKSLSLCRHIQNILFTLLSFSVPKICEFMNFNKNKTLFKLILIFQAPVHSPYRIFNKIKMWFVTITFTETLNFKQSSDLQKNKKLLLISLKMFRIKYYFHISRVPKCKYMKWLTVKNKCISTHINHYIWSFFSIQQSYSFFE